MYYELEIAKLIMKIEELVSYSNKTVVRNYIKEIVENTMKYTNRTNRILITDFESTKITNIRNNIDEFCNSLEVDDKIKF